MHMAGKEALRTYLQMKSRDEFRPSAARAADATHLRIVEATVKQWQFNRFLYTLVGSEWSWFEKLSWTDGQWASYAESDALRTFVGYFDGSPAGYFELKNVQGEVEIAYFGLAPRFIGQGLGGLLLSAAIEAAWAMSPSRVWLHTCTLDHPNAVKNYEARGFKAYKQEAFIFTAG
jgi:GNAT superfamily N-acetyltransferase